MPKYVGRGKYKGYRPVKKPVVQSPSQIVSREYRPNTMTYNPSRWTQMENPAVTFPDERQQAVSDYGTRMVERLPNFMNVPGYGSIPNYSTQPSPLLGTAPYRPPNTSPTLYTKFGVAPYAPLYNPFVGNPAVALGQAGAVTKPGSNGYHGLGNVRQIRQQIYNKAQGNEAQGTTETAETGGGDGGGGGGGWSDWGGGGGYDYSSSVTHLHSLNTGRVTRHKEAHHSKEWRSGLWDNHKHIVTIMQFKSTGKVDEFINNLANLICHSSRLEKIKTKVRLEESGRGSRCVYITLTKASKINQGRKPTIREVEVTNL